MDNESGKLIHVADGFILDSNQFSKSHNLEIRVGHLRVSLQTIVEEFQNLELPVTLEEYDIETLRDAKGTFVQWPADWVQKNGEVIAKFDL